MSCGSAAGVYAVAFLWQVNAVLAGLSLTDIYSI
jgi:hypothetical protein